MKFKILSHKIFIILLLLVVKIKPNDILNEEKLSSNIAIIPFKIFYPTEQYNKYRYPCREYINTIHLSVPYLEIEIGKNIKNINLSKEVESKIKNNKQFITLFLSINDNSFFIEDNYSSDDDEEKNILCRYSSKLSTSYELEPNKNNVKGYKDYIISNDFFKIYNDFSMDKYEMIKIEFKHFFDESEKMSFACGEIGILPFPFKKKFEFESSQNLFNQLHNKIKNIDYSFSFKFNNEDKKDYGLLVIGYESIEKNNNVEFIPVYSKQSYSSDQFEWRFEIDQITIDNESYDFINEEIIIKTDIEGIEVPYPFHNKLDKLFFNKYYKSKICQSDIINDVYIVTYCNSTQFTTKDIKMFPIINFYKTQIGYNFTFLGDELFYEKDGVYIFKMISYLERYKVDFHFGRIFLKKYKIIFNPESKLMLFYKNNIIKNDKSELNIQKKNIGLLVTSYIFIGFLFLSIGIFFSRKYCKISRKIYANELEDGNFIYESKNKDIKKERKLIEF